MAFVDDNSNQQSQQVAGSTPLSGGQPESAPSEASQGSTGGSGASPMASSGSTQQAPKGPSRGSGKASSGMYTNIQKYVDKNRPQAQNMAGAVTQNVGNQAQDINRVAQQKQQEQQKLIDINNQKMQAQQQEAQGFINQATQGGNLTEQDTARFQELMQGPTGTQQVGNINLAAQQNRANALQQLAQSGRTEEGRRNLLKDTFQRQGDYTQGMSGLDQLIVSGDQAAREGIVQGTADTANQLNQNLQQLAQQGQEAAAGYKTAAGEFGQGITSMGEQALTGVDTQLEEQFNQELERRAALTGDYDTALQSMQNWQQSAAASLGPLETDQDLANLILNSGVDLGWRGQSYFERLAAGDVLDPNTRTTYRIDENRFKNAINQIANRAQFGGSGKVSGVQTGSDVFAPIWDTSSSSRASSADQYFNLDSIRSALQGLRGSIQGVNVEQQLANQIRNASGQSLEDYMAGVGLDKYDTASDESISSYENLKNLMGQTDYSEDLRNTDFTQTDTLRNLLKGYNV